MKAIFVGGKLNGTEMDVEDIKKYLNVIGYSHDWSTERSQGECVPRKELDNQPVVIGYLSPMWDGGRLRYETQEVYDLYFD